MRMDYKLSRIIVIVIAVIYICLGIAQAKFGIEIDKNISNGLMVVAAVIFFIGRKPNPSSGNSEEEVVEISNRDENNQEKVESEELKKDKEE